MYILRLAESRGDVIYTHQHTLCGVIFGGFWVALGIRAAACGDRVNELCE